MLKSVLGSSMEIFSCPNINSKLVGRHKIAYLALVEKVTKGTVRSCKLEQDLLVKTPDILLYFLWLMSIIITSHCFGNI